MLYKLFVMQTSSRFNYLLENVHIVHTTHLNRLTFLHKSLPSANSSTSLQLLIFELRTCITFWCLTHLRSWFCSATVALSFFILLRSFPFLKTLTATTSPKSTRVALNTVPNSPETIFRTLLYTLTFV